MDKKMFNAAPEHKFYRLRSNVTAQDGSVIAAGETVEAWTGRKGWVKGCSGSKVYVSNPGSLLMEDDTLGHINEAAEEFGRIDHSTGYAEYCSRKCGLLGKLDAAIIRGLGIGSPFKTMSGIGAVLACLLPILEAVSAIAYGEDVPALVMLAIILPAAAYMLLSLPKLLYMDARSRLWARMRRAADEPGIPFDLTGAMKASGLPVPDEVITGRAS